MAYKPLTPRQAVALQLTLEGLRKGEVCERMGISQRTLWTWRRLPAWNEALEITLKEETSDGDALVRTFYPMAVGILRKLALTSSDAIKLGACRTLVEAHVQMVQRQEQQQVLADLESRLEELQDAARNQGLLPHAHGAEVLDVELEEGFDSCVPAPPPGTQTTGQASADQGVQNATAADVGQTTRIGQRSGSAGQDHPAPEAC
jgi:DNA-binding transcriptional MerR regulator